jgi:hypothetical protein
LFIKKGRGRDTDPSLPVNKNMGEKNQGTINFYMFYLTSKTIK